EPLLVGRVRRDRRLVAEGASGAKRRHLRLDDLTAGLHEAGIEFRVLPGGHGKIAAVHVHVQEPVPGIDRPWHRPIGDGTWRLQGAGPAERGRGGGRRRGVGSGRIRAEYVAVETISDALDGRPGTQLGRPEIPGDQVVEQGVHVPAVAWRVRMPLAGLDPGNNAAGLVERL